MRSLPWLAVVLLLAAPAAAHAGQRVITLHMPTFRVPPRSNREVCVFLPMPSNDAMDVGEVSIVNRGGNAHFATHHMIVYQYAGSLDDLPKKGRVVDDTACINFGGTQLHIVATSQAIRSHQPMPRGTALRLEPGALEGKKAIGLVLNSHWINGSDKTQRARVSVKLKAAEHTQKLLEPIFEVTANGPLGVPPGKITSTRGFWGPGLRNFGSQALGGADNPPDAACVTMLISHMHRRGTLFTATLNTPGTPPHELYRNTRYSDPPALNIDPPLLVQRGQTVEYECTQDNATDTRLGCEEAPGETPGLSVIALVLSEPTPDFEHTDFSQAAAKLCHTPGPDPEECPATDPKHPGRTYTGNCVPANLVFGFTSEDEMCILPGYYYDADPTAPAGHECDL